MELIIKKLKSKVSRACVVINNYLDIVENNIDKRYQDIAKKLEDIFKDDLLREERDTNTFLTKTWYYILNFIA